MIAASDEFDKKFENNLGFIFNIYLFFSKRISCLIKLNDNTDPKFNENISFQSMVSHFDELVNQVRYQLSVRFLTTSTIHAQQGNFKTDLMTAYLPKDSKQSIQVVVDEIWNTYDVDNDGIMTEAEVSHFIHEYMPLF